MIILSGVLVVVAIALLVAGIVAGNGDSAQVFGLDALVVIYISIAVSIVSALCLAIGVFLRRKELFGPAVPVAPARTTKKSKKDKKDKKDKRSKSAPPAPAKAATGVPEGAPPPAEPADDEVEVPAPPADVPEDALVFVVRGRKRYHLDTCRQLAGRETEELTYAEAREEGFSSCTACMPDTALAARAAASAPASSDAGRAATGAGSAAAPGTGAQRSEGGLAGIARPASSALSFDEPPSFTKPSAAGTSGTGTSGTGTSDKSGPSDRTAEIPRADEPEPEAPAPRPAGPTLTDIPVAGLFGSAKEAPTAPESAEPAAEDSGDRPARERAAETESAPPDVTVDLGTAPFGAADAPSAPRPRDAEDEDEDPLRTGREESRREPASDAAADDDEPAAHEPEPSASGSADPEPGSEPEGEGPLVRILSGTKRYHRVDCALIEDIGDDADDLETLSRAEAKSRGCTPCLVCQPDREHARD